MPRYSRYRRVAGGITRRAPSSRRRSKPRRSTYSRKRRGNGLGAYRGVGMKMPGPPNISNPKRGGELATQVRHREYLGDVMALPGGFGVPWQIVGQQEGYSLNPGIKETFPWLSQVAQNYVQYEMNGLLVEYISTSGAAVGSSSNQALGSVSLACQYDAVLPPYNSKSEMLNEQYAVSTVPSRNLILPIECAPQQTILTKQYIRTGAQPANTDIRLYDLGKVFVATDGIQDVVGGTQPIKLGELWITYDIILLKASLTLQDSGDPSANGATVCRRELDTIPPAARLWPTSANQDFAPNPAIVTNDIGLICSAPSAWALPANTCTQDQCVEVVYELFCPTVFGACAGTDTYVGNCTFNTLDNCTMRDQIFTQTLAHGDAAVTNATSFVFTVWFTPLQGRYDQPMAFGITPPITLPHGTMPGGFDSWGWTARVNVVSLANAFPLANNRVV